MSGIACECYFLDVGQGTSQVILLSDGSAIVIDCGPSFHVLGDLLVRKLGITRIAALILSHNHSDHTGGLTGLVLHYRKSIDRIFLLQDQPAMGMQGMLQYSVLRDEYEKGNVPAPIPLVRHSDSLLIYSSGNPAKPLNFEVLFPTFFDNIDGQVTGNQNYTCGVLLLTCGSKRVLFPGDAEIDAWRSIHNARKSRPVACDVMAIPHHGGQIVRYRKKGESYEELHSAIASDLQWLYTNAIKSRLAIVSVGTSNSYPDQHPLPPHIDAVRTSGCSVMCTQITSRCSDNLERLRPGVLDPASLPCQSQRTKATTTGGQSKDLACAGTVLVQVGPEDICVVNQYDHSAAIDSKLTSPADHALCRRC